MNSREIINDIPIYWINLDRSVDRRERMEQMFNEHGITYHYRIPAVDANDIDIDEIYNSKFFRIKYTKRKMTNCEIAIMMSHKKAIHQAYQDNFSNLALIIEDDCLFDFLKYHSINLRDLFSLCRRKTILQLALNVSAHIANCFKEEYISGIKVKKGFANSATAYLIHRNYMTTIFDTKNLCIADTRDGLYSSKTYLSLLPYFTFNFTDSTNCSTHNDKHKKCHERWKFILEDINI